MSNVQQYTVSGMTCAHCEGAVREEVSQIPGIENIEVSSTDGTLAVTASAPVDDAAIIEAVDEAGYEAVRT